MYKGVIIDESLKDKNILNKLKILGRRISPVTEKSKTPWLTQWTLIDVEVPEDQAQRIAETISQAIDPNHAVSWYADYKDENWHYIIFKNKIFKVDRTSKAQYDQVFSYGLSLGVPDYQLPTFERHGIKIAN